LNPAVLRDALGYLRLQGERGELPADTQFLLTTNGLFVTDDIVRLCAEHAILPVVGIDGTEELHDAFRKDRSGNGSFQEALGAIRKFREAGVRVCASTAVTPANLGHLQEIARFLEAQGVEKIGFNFLKGPELAKLVADKERYYRAASREIIANYRNADRKDFEFQMEKKHRAFYGRDFFPLDCTCYGNQLVVRPDGLLGSCPFADVHFGHVRSVPPDFRVRDQPEVKGSRGFLPLNHPSYADFDAKSLCGGGCRWGSEGSIDAGMKIFAEEVFNEFLEAGSRE
jgi:sulfatase maturation enzyme AslB (radical SAM superfamily)